MWRQPALHRYRPEDHNLLATSVDEGSSDRFADGTTDCSNDDVEDQPWQREVHGHVPFAAFRFAIAHLPLGSPLLAGIALLCGLYWSALRSLTRSVVPSLIAHLAWDLALILVPLNR